MKRGIRFLTGFIAAAITYASLMAFVGPHYAGWQYSRYWHDGYYHNRWHHYRDNWRQQPPPDSVNSRQYYY